MTSKLSDRKNFGWFIGCICRKLSQIRQQRLLAVITWGQKILHIPTKPAVIANVSEVIHAWLQRHYAPGPSEVSE